ncbi:kinase-like domain-containing protein [Sporodiniella umbellata]|nr:kinase-like domain-containing protein [Sporodiniella umbellata]
MDSKIVAIKVTELPIVVMDSIEAKYKTVPEFSITVVTDNYTLNVIRYVPDLEVFDQLVKSHYQRIRIPFPHLAKEKKAEDKRKSIRHFFHLSVKTDADKVERYLERCVLNPLLKSSTLLRDFLSPQREGDIKKMPSRESLSPDASIASEQVVRMWEPGLSPSIIESLNRESVQSLSVVETMFPLDAMEMVKVLGKGCMGKVLLVRSRKTKDLYALKSIVKRHVIEQREITHTIDERNILVALSEINHPYLAKLHTAFQDEHRLYLLTDYYSGGDLATHMARHYVFPKEAARFYAAEIVEGISELHRLGILYRDLKPENILITADGHIILTDFGLSKWLDNDDQTQTFCGTAEYLAPEVLLGDPYSFGIDHWSFGTILYEMLAGFTPFWADSHTDMYQRVLEDPLEFPSDIFDYETAEFISDLLDRDPLTRLGAGGCDEIKQHVYFADISWEAIRERAIEPTDFLTPVKDEMDFTNFEPDFLSMSPVLTAVPSEADLSEEIQTIFENYSFADLSYENDPQQQAVPARKKRGSISLLSDQFLGESLDEITRHIKRRNTNASEGKPSNTLDVRTKDVTDIIDPSTFELSTLPDLQLSFDMNHPRSSTIAAASSSNSRKSRAKRFFSLLL